MSVNLLDQSGDFLNLPLHTLADALPYSGEFPYGRTTSLSYLIQYLEAKQTQATGPAQRIHWAIVEEMKKVEQQLRAGGQHVAIQADLFGLLEVLFPEFLEGNAVGFATRPFDREFLYYTPGMDQLHQDERYRLHWQKTPVAGWASSAVAQAGGLILNTFYGQPFDFSISDVFAIEDVRTGLVRYKRLQASYDYFRVLATQPPPELSGNVLQQLLENFEDTELWLRYLPSSHFRFEGIVFGRMTDVTASEANARLKERLLNDPLPALHPDGSAPQELLSFVQRELRNYLGIAGLCFGLFQLPGAFRDAVAFKGSLLGEGVEDNAAIVAGTCYGEVVQTKRPSIVEDVNLVPNKGEVEARLLEQKIRSLVLAPLLDERDRLMGIIELASPVPNQLNAFTLLRMKGLFYLFDSGFSRFRRRWEVQRDRIVQKKFTNLHPGIRWKFEAAATRFLQQEQRGVMPEVAFEQLIPLYGQADIVGSTHLRNQATQKDLLATAELVKQALDDCQDIAKPEPLEQHRAAVAEQGSRLKTSFSSVEASAFVDLLAERVHPFLNRLALGHPELGERISGYFKSITAAHHTVYRYRADYEQSLNSVNYSLLQYMEREQQALQDILPHYFSLYRTDGIEYNLYMGQAILQDGVFSAHHQQHFERWQLQSLIGITRLMARLRPQLSVPMQTAQLVFAYGSSIDLRFRPDEKRFDVHGANGMQYEMLKKRIDKALVADTGERLTQPGTLSVVYLQPRDHEKYYQLLLQLAGEKYLETVEDLALAPMQGATGLRALRARVVLVG